MDDGIILDKSYRKRPAEPPKKKKVRVPLDMGGKCKHFGYRDELMSHHILDGMTVFVYKK